MVIPCLYLFAYIWGKIVRAPYRRHEKSPQTEWSGGIFLGRHSYRLETAH